MTLQFQNNSFLFEYILTCNLFLWFKAEFSASLLQSSVSQDPLKSILICRFAARETINFIIINAIPFLLLLGLKLFQKHNTCNYSKLFSSSVCILHIALRNPRENKLYYFIKICFFFSLRPVNLKAFLYIYFQQQDRGRVKLMIH